MLSRLQQFALYKRLQALVKQREHLFVPGLLVGGFIADVITFRTLSPRTTFIVTGAYAAVAGAAILYRNIFDARQAKPTHPVLNYLRLSTTFLTQFTFGALLSSAFLFYWFSGSFSASWPLMVVVVALMATADLLRKFYLRPAVQVVVYAFVLFSYFSVLFPFVFRSLSPAAFVLGGALSSCIVLLMLAVMLGAGSVIDHAARRLVLVVLAIFGVMNGLYFANVIPPIPLFIREAGVYHQVTPQAGDYLLEGEPQGFFDALWPVQTLGHDEDGRAYLYTAISAPEEVVAPIFHRWEWYDPARQAWVEMGRPSFVLRGGREAGYRGYTFTSRLRAGSWRVTVETERGQVLGRVRFSYEG
jgi:hypothetical protein